MFPELKDEAAAHPVHSASLLQYADYFERQCRTRNRAVPKRMWSVHNVAAQKRTNNDSEAWNSKWNRAVSKAGHGYYETVLQIGHQQAKTQNSFVQINAGVAPQRCTLVHFSSPNPTITCAGKCDPTQLNPWMDPTYVHLCGTTSTKGKIRQESRQDATVPRPLDAPASARHRPQRCHRHPAIAAHLGTCYLQMTMLLWNTTKMTIGLELLRSSIVHDIILIHITYAYSLRYKLITYFN